MIHPINWALISEAVKFYQDLGFDYVEVPWKVDAASAMVTCPPDGALEMSDGLALIASAEQGFIDLARHGMLPWFNSGINFVACTPCFRALDTDRSPIHHPYFMKVELFVKCDTKKTAKMAVPELMDRAHKFMDRLPRPVETESGWDLEIAGVEVGSYGYKYHKEVGHWAYGTGLAEPRYSQALAIREKKNQDG